MRNVRRPWHDLESMANRRRRSKAIAEELGAPIARQEQNEANEGAGQEKEDAVENEKKGGAGYLVQ